MVVKEIAKTFALADGVKVIAPFVAVREPVPVVIVLLVSINVE